MFNHVYLSHGIKNDLTQFVVTGVIQFKLICFSKTNPFYPDDYWARLSMDVPIFSLEVVDVVDRIFLPPISR